MNGFVIEVRGLVRVYPGQGDGRSPALQGVDLAVRAGESVAVVGRSGSGKTTLLNILGGLDRHWSGEVLVRGKDLGRLGDEELSDLRNRHLGFVFQAFHLLPHMTVLENVLLPSWFGDGALLRAGPDRAEAALRRVGLWDRASDLPGRLSAGERQRVAVARALLNRPSLLLCDEPTGNLDRETGQVVLDLLLDLNREGTTLVIATHEDRISRVSGRTVELREGRVVRDETREPGGPPGGGAP
ncbi:ABC transporter ATP-binding protein [Myxococcota bacterium]|jgi:putative ABC transport system ATP-binding protein|nr:ABC transporter ATP-binding protein [Myxococcota bacterium]